jgi:apolipoprotein N-acyltransferase
LKLRYEPTRRSLSSLGAGIFTALSLPPWGWWPMLFLGVGWFLLLVNEPNSSRRSNTWLAALWTIAWLAPAMWWMKSLSVPGYIAAVAAFAGFHAFAEYVAQLAVVHADRSTMRHRLTLQVLTHSLAEVIRFSFPFGGVPLASFGIALAASPFAFLARFGGVILLTLFGFAVAAMAARTFANPRSVNIAGVCALLIGGALLPRLSNFSHQVGTLRIAIVQGGGDQGTRAINSDPNEVLQRHLEATRSISSSSDIDVVVWPENVIDVELFAKSSALELVAAEAKRLDAPLLVGITEDIRPGRFLNAQVVVEPDGSVSDRYDKVRRVPFGEYMPLRGLLDALGAPVDLVPNDAVAGTTPAILDVLENKFAVAISWEIFFGGRVNEGVERGGQLVINPTNGSSYTGTILQTQQVASSRLRAIESSRWVTQAAPTGFSAFIDHNGNVLQRSSVSEQIVMIKQVQLREGRTPYSRLGDAPLIAILLILLAGATIRARARLRISAH